MTDEEKLQRLAKWLNVAVFAVPFLLGLFLGWVLL